MKVRIETKPEFSLAGVLAKQLTPPECPGIWDQLFSKASPIALEKLGNGQSFGMCHGMEAPGHFDYMAAYDMKDLDSAQALGLDVVEIPENTYAIVEIVGPIPQSIHQGWDYMLEDWLPKNGYDHSGAPDFEFYYDGDMQQPDYKMELWIPIVKI